MGAGWLASDRTTHALTTTQASALIGTCPPHELPSPPALIAPADFAQDRYNTIGTS